MKKKNCWEFKKCGREPGGAKVEEFGVCAAAVDQRYDGRHGGENGGRKCWHVNATLCGGSKQGTFFKKAANCVNCDFFKLVKDEEGDDFGF